jgi:hypothetical protein
MFNANLNQNDVDEFEVEVLNSRIPDATEPGNPLS